MSKKSRYNVALVGATGAVGETLVGILQEASQWWAANDVPFWAFMTVESPAPPAR